MTCQPGECIPVDVSPVFAGELPEHPLVRCAVCLTWAEWVTPAELAEAWGDMLAARPVAGQTSWLG